MPNSVAARPRIVVLASGGGTNCQVLIDACQADDLLADVVGIVTNNPGAGVLARAEAAGVPSHVIEHRGRDADQRRAADRVLIELVLSLEPDLVVLAGWMRILGAEVGAALRMINLHPAKPGEFPGIRSIERAYEAWQQGEITESGVMVHWVPDEGVDVGPVIAVRVVPFAESDSLADFEARMHATEHQILVQACALALEMMGKNPRS